MRVKVTDWATAYSVYLLSLSVLHLHFSKFLSFCLSLASQLSVFLSISSSVSLSLALHFLSLPS